MMTNQKQVRAAFWEAASTMPGEDTSLVLVSKRRMRDGDYNTDTRCAFVDFVDALQKSGEISEKLAGRVTL